MCTLCVRVCLPVQLQLGSGGNACVPGVGYRCVPASAAGLAEAAERGGLAQPLPRASAPRLSSYISRRRGPRSRGSSNEMEQQKDGEIRLPALPQQIKRWD